MSRQRTRALMMIRAAAMFTFVFGAVGTAWAGGLDGTWTRDDGKSYLICGNDGVAVDSGATSSYGCRLQWIWTPGAPIRMRFRFTKTDGESGYFETTASSTESFPAEDFPSRLPMSFEWVDLDDEGRVTERGFEERTLERTRPLDDRSRAGALAALAAHREADAFLDPSGGTFEPARALEVLEVALAEGACKDDPGLESRRRALSAVVGSAPRVARRPAPSSAVNSPPQQPPLPSPMPTSAAPPLVVTPTGASTAPALVEAADASLGYTIQIPVGALATKRDRVHTYTLVLADGVSEISVSIVRGGTDDLATLVEEATLFGTTEIVEKKRLPSGAVLVVKRSELDGLSQQVWASIQSGHQGATVTCTAPARELPRMLAICASLQCRSVPSRGTSPPTVQPPPSGTTGDTGRPAGATKR